MFLRSLCFMFLFPFYPCLSDLPITTYSNYIRKLIKVAWSWYPGLGTAKTWTSYLYLGIYTTLLTTPNTCYEYACLYALLGSFLFTHIIDDFGRFSTWLHSMLHGFPLYSRLGRRLWLFNSTGLKTKLFTGRTSVAYRSFVLALLDCNSCNHTTHFLPARLALSRRWATTRLSCRPCTNVS